MDEIKMKVKSFLARYLKNYQLSDEEDIFALGFVNSLFSMQLVMFLEKEFSIKIDNQDLDLDNFRTIHRISDLVMRKSA